MMVAAMFGMLILPRGRFNAWRIIGCLILILGVVLLRSSLASIPEARIPSLLNEICIGWDQQDLSE